jgi:hypothetical protein
MVANLGQSYASFEAIQFPLSYDAYSTKIEGNHRLIRSLIWAGVVQLF